MYSRTISVVAPARDALALWRPPQQRSWDEKQRETARAGPEANGGQNHSSLAAGVRGSGVLLKYEKGRRGGKPRLALAWEVCCL